MFATPQEEHRWLERLSGTWAAETECMMGPDKPMQKNSSIVEGRSLGGLWMVFESSGEAPEGGAWSTMITLGYDPQAKQYLGTFVGSMMTHLWIYQGQVDASGKVLVLDCEGPVCDTQGGGMAKYQDIIEIVSDDHWILRSQMQDKDGNWMPIMTGHHHRVQRQDERKAV